MPSDLTTDAPADHAFVVDSRPYACRCGTVVYWRATINGLVVLESDGEPHRARCPLKGSRMLTPRDLAYLRDFDAQHPPTRTVVVKAEATVDRRTMDKIADAVTELGLAVDETRVLSRTVARYAAQVDHRSASRPREDRHPPPTSTTGEPTRGASVVRTGARGGAGPEPST